MKKMYLKLKQLLNRIADYQVPLYAANASFYLILSFFPAVMLLLCLLPLFGFSSGDLLSALQSVTPNVVHPLLESIIQDLSANTSGVLISVTAVVAVWSSSRSVFCIQQGLNAIHRVTENRSYLWQRLFSMLYMLLLIAALLLTLILHGFGSTIADFLETKSVPILRLFVRLLRFRGLILLVLLSGLFTAFYCILPNRKVPFRRALPGAVLASLGWQIFTYLFSFYVRHSGSYPILYGSLVGIAAGMLWLFICFSILFYGCVFNLWLEKRK